MELFGSLTSPFVRHCRIALAEENIDYTLVPTNMAKSAELSPAKRVPFLRDGDLFLSDSTAIIHHVRQLAGKSMFANAQETDQYCLANTVLDSAINLFILEKHGCTPKTVPYLQRQRERIDACLSALEKTDLSVSENPNDAQWRVACMMSWSIYRKRFGYDTYPMLTRFFNEIQSIERFQATAPPPA